ncbi:unnamed protein product [Aspergillus oryzae]|nr:unnamed protein product [Aspergillus oryzae]GMF92132.1 unnamed protein product [Aspergillus oryzae]
MECSSISKVSISPSALEGGEQRQWTFLENPNTTSSVEWWHFVGASLETTEYVRSMEKASYGADTAETHWISTTMVPLICGSYMESKSENGAKWIWNGNA